MLLKAAYPYGLFGDGPTCKGQFGKQGFRGDELYWPWYCDISNTGDVAIADTDNDRIQVFNSSTFTSIFPPFGGKGSGPDCLRSPRSVKFSTIPGTSLAVADTGNRRISLLRINFQLGKLEHAFSFGSTILQEPSDVAIDRRNGNILVVDSALNKVFIFSSCGELIGEVEQRGFTFKNPSGVTVTHDGKSDVYVSDTGNHCLRRFSCNGDYLGVLGSLGCQEGQFNCPRGVSVDRRGYIFVSDEQNNRVQMFTPDLAHMTTAISGVPLPKGVCAGLELIVTTADQLNFVKVYRSC